jgi:hypothetical protein
MEKLKQSAGDLLSRISSGFSHGLGQMAALGGNSNQLPYRSRSSAEAFQGDWERVGSDLGRAIDTGRERYREKV